MKMVDSRRDHSPKFDLQMDGQVVVVDEQGSDMMIGWMNGVKTVLLQIVEVNVAVVVVGEVVVDGVVQVVESAGVEVLVVAVVVVVVVVVVVEVVVEVEVEEPLEVDTAEEER